MQNNKLCGIYIVWDDWDWLELSLESNSKFLDEIIVVWSSGSNFSEISERPEIEIPLKKHVRFVNAEPDLKKSPLDNETFKRNIGLDWARKTDCTHFLMMDSDEFYTKEDIEKGFEEIGDNAGLICSCKTYFKRPTLTIGLDNTLVPFIHKLTPEIEFGWNRNYPFAWVNNQIRIDPTRQMNLNKGVVMSSAVMHHFSWVRKDVKKKIRNSTARVNLERSSILRDYAEAKEGYFCEFYKKRLEACPNIFGLPEITDESISVPIIS
jgi:hypothetical protein